MSAVCVEAPEHLNSTGCVIRNTPDKGRGVFGIKPVNDLEKSSTEAHGIDLVQLLKRSPLRQSSRLAPFSCLEKTSTLRTGNTQS